jgi:threonine/homoserine/homoserine lactone efflux protein
MSGTRRLIAMSIFEALGLVWIVLTSFLATVGLFYLAYIGLKALLKKEVELPTEVKEMFRIAK